MGAHSIRTQKAHNSVNCKPTSDQASSPPHLRPVHNRSGPSSIWVHSNQSRLDRLQISPILCPLCEPYSIFGLGRFVRSGPEPMDSPSEQKHNFVIHELHFSFQVFVDTFLEEIFVHCLEISPFMFLSGQFPSTNIVKLRL